MILAAWLLITISYDHVVHVFEYPTEAACNEARQQPNSDRDRMCVPNTKESP